MTGRQNDTPILITEARPSADDEYAARKRKYTIMMALRLPCLILAGVYYQIWWLALIFVAISIPLPWIAVLIANDRPPRKSEKVSWFRHRHAARQLEDREHPVIEG
ncbi:MAG TPA: DUF3099 domain-containing protein [Pseudonocardiaceae bacterium]